MGPGLFIPTKTFQGLLANKEGAVMCNKDFFPFVQAPWIVHSSDAHDSVAVAAHMFALQRHSVNVDWRNSGSMNIEELPTVLHKVLVGINRSKQVVVFCIFYPGAPTNS